MRFITISIFSVAGRLVSLATAKPIPIQWSTSGMAIPLSRHSSDFLDSDKNTDFDAIASHGISIREKIISGLDNYMINTGTVHPFAVKPSEPGFRKRGAKLPLKSHPNNVWIGEISIGTPAKTMNVHIDTGSADMWVLQTGCSGISGVRNFWDPQLSESSTKQAWPFQLSYEDETIVDGDLYIDNVTIAGFTADPQVFGSATSYTSEILGNSDADGLLGLAFPSVSKLHVSSLFASLFTQRKLINPVFSLKLSSTGAEMYVGGANSMLYNGDITYTPVTHLGFWQVSMDDIRVNGHKILENVPAILDTGANLIYGDSGRVSRLYRRLGGTLKNYEGFDFYYLPCDSFPTVSITFGGKKFAIPPGALRLHPIEEGSSDCFSAIVADPSPDRGEPPFAGHCGSRWTRSDYTGLDFWVVGSPFLQGVYSVFDYGIAQVGFAELA